MRIKWNSEYQRFCQWAHARALAVEDVGDALQCELVRPMCDLVRERIRERHENRQQQRGYLTESDVGGELSGTSCRRTFKGMFDHRRSSFYLYRDEQQDFDDIVRLYEETMDI